MYQAALVQTSDRFVTYLRAASHNQSIDVIAKKINMQLPFSWEHERSVIPFFSIITYAFRFNAKRQAALTLSGLSHPSEITRRSISDSSIDSTVLTSNIRTIAEATLSMILPLPEVMLSFGSSIHSLSRSELLIRTNE